MPSEKTKNDLINRIKTIKGHLSGIEKMIDNDKPCEEILFQVSAIKSSIYKVGSLIMEDYAKECILKRDQEGHLDKQELEDVIDTIIKYSK